MADDAGAAKARTSSAAQRFLGRLAVRLNVNARVVHAMGMAFAGALLAAALLVAAHQRAPATAAATMAHAPLFGDDAAGPRRVGRPAVAKAGRTRGPAHRPDGELAQPLRREGERDGGRAIPQRDDEREADEEAGEDVEAEEDEPSTAAATTAPSSRAPTHTPQPRSSAAAPVDRDTVLRLLSKEGLVQPVPNANPTVLAKSDVDNNGNTAKFLSLPPNSHETRFNVDADLLRALPPNDYASDGSDHHRTCAIVGNSGTLLKSGKGRDIDAHDAVLRMNYAPTKGFEADVGSKTTYDLSNRENARFLLKGEIGGDSRKGGHGLRPSTLLFFEVASPINRRAIFNPLLKKFSDKRIHFLHPSFVARAQRLWFGLKSAIEAKTHAKYHDKPMSGLYAVLFSLTVCDEVDLYGFEAYTSKKTATAPYHYFDKVQGVTTVHSFDLALTIFKALGSAKPLRIK